MAKDTTTLSKLQKDIYDDIRSGSNIVNGDEYRAIISSLARVAAEAVVKTLGPYGATTVVDDGNIAYPTKDGWQVIKTLSFNDPIYNTLFRILTSMSFNSAHRVGDGTTTAMTVANSFIAIMMHYLSENPDIRQADFLEALNVAMSQIVQRLQDAPELIRIDKDGDMEDLYRVAYIASNGNEELSRMIQMLYRETHNPDIYFEISPNSTTMCQVDDGYRFNCRPIFLDAFRNDDSLNYKETDKNILAFFFDHAINYQEHSMIIEGISAYAGQKSVLIFATHFDDTLCNIITTNIRQQAQRGMVPNIILVQYSLTTELDKGTLRDLSYMTNAQIFDYGKARAFRLIVAKQKGEDIKTTVDDTLAGAQAYTYETTQALLEDCCGHISTLILNDNFCIIKDWERFGDAKLFAAEKEKARLAYEKAKRTAEFGASELNKDYLNAQLRHIRLSGKMGRIYIGGPSNTEKRYLYDVVEDVIFGCKSAYEHGTIRGMNLLTLSILKDMHTKEESQILKDVYGMFYDAFYDVTLCVMKNKYHVLDKPIKCNIPGGCSSEAEMKPAEIIEYAIEHGFGFNLISDSFEDSKEGFSVINPVNTDIEIIKSAVGVLSTVMSSSQMITINRRFDRGMSKQIQRNEELETLKKNAESTMAGQLNALSSAGVLVSQGLNLVIKNR